MKNKKCFYNIFLFLFFILFIIFNYTTQIQRKYALKTSLQIHKKRKNQYQYKADRVYNAFDFAADGFASYPLYHGKNNARAVECGKRYQIKHGKIYPDKSGNIQKTPKPARFYCACRDCYRRERAAQRIYTYHTRKQLTEYRKHHTRKFKRVFETAT